MRILIPGILTIILSGLILILHSCDTGSCLEETEAFVKVSFYDDVTKNLRAPDSLTIYGLNMDTTKLYNKTSSVQPAFLPLNASTDNCTFVILINGISDTLEFRYSSYPHLISKECGYTFYHTLDTAPPVYSQHAIIKIYESNRNITNVNAENIRIFY
jgi:hypothetical protein